MKASEQSLPGFETEEYWFRWNASTGLSELDMRGLHDEDVAIRYKRDMDAFREAHPEYTQEMLLTNSENLGKMTMGARRRYGLQGQDDEYHHIAIFGLNAMFRAMASFVLRASGQNNITKVFKTRDEALSWLLEQQR